MILVAIVATEPERIAEALRAAVGLGLRGEPVEVWLADAAAAARPPAARAHRTLAELGVPLHSGRFEPLVDRARVVERWS